MSNTGEGDVGKPAGGWVLTSAILASSMAFIDQSALNVALPAIQSSLNARGTELLWILNGYILMLATFILLGGSLGDKIGRRRVFIVGIALFALASLACGLSPTIGFLIGARVIQGIGGALMIPGSLAIISASFSPDRRGRAIGTWSAATTITTVAGPVIGGFLAEAGLWRVVFLINIPLAAIALVILIIKVPESKNEEDPPGLDLLGALLATISLVALAYGFISAPEYGFANPRIYGSVALGIFVLIIFLIAEKQSTRPMVPLTLFRSRSFSGANLLTLFLYGALAAYGLFLSLNIIQVQGYRESLAGLAFLPFVLLLAGLSRWAGQLSDRIGPRPLLIVGPALVGIGFFMTTLVGLTGGPGDYWRSFFPGIIVFGIGMGLTVAPLTTTVMTSVHTRFAGTASGINNATSRVAGVLAIAILGSVALFSFQSSMEEFVAGVDLSMDEKAAIMKEVTRFGDAQVPEEISKASYAQVSLSLKTAFIYSFRLVMYICSGLAWMSAVIAALFIKKRQLQSE